MQTIVEQKKTVETTQETRVTEEITITVIRPKKISTLEAKHILPLRKCGNSTRQVNFAVEMLFQGYRVKVQDHYDDGKSRRVNKYLFNKIMKRLENENEFSRLLEAGKVSADFGTLEIQFI